MSNSATTTDQERWTNLKTLEQTEAKRGPLDRLNRRIVSSVLEKYLPPRRGKAQLLEIGAGVGQLRHWLPLALHSHVTHTELSEIYVDEFRKRHPDASVARASAYSLPCADASQTAVLGLCVFDVLSDWALARDELLRVLMPGGIFVHFLDSAAAVIERMFQEIVSRGRLPLPNFVADEMLRQRIDSSQRNRLPATGRLDDLAIVDRARFDRLLNLLIEADHPLGTLLVPYAKAFSPERFDARAAARAFMVLNSDTRRLAEMNQALLALYLTVCDDSYGKTGQYQETGSLDVETAASWEYFKQSLESHFSPEHGFDCELSEIVVAREVVPRDNDTPPGCKFVSRSIGKSMLRGEVPAEPFGRFVQSLGTSREDSRLDVPAIYDSIDDQHILLESGMFVFVARKRPPVASITK